MKRFRGSILAPGVLAIGACGVSPADSTDSTAGQLETDVVPTPASVKMGPHGIPEEPPMLGLHRARDGAARHGTGKNTNLIWHNGAIMTDAAVTAIFWGSRWTNVAFVGDKIAGLDAFYVGLDDSSYARTNTEYTGPNTTRVGAGVRYDGHVVDGSDTGFSSGPAASAVLTEVCKMIPIPVADGYYPVYTDVRRGTAGYCAWHSYGTCSGVAVQFAFFFDLDSDSGCDPRDTSNTHSQGLAALANVSGHEYSEALTDPRGAGWYDLRGDENSDKCAWSWPDGAPLLVAFPKNNTRWKIQANWSNAAYTAGTGFVNRSGQPGCVFTSPP